MALVDYASSGSEADLLAEHGSEEGRPSKKRKLSEDHAELDSKHRHPPPLPTAFRSMYVANVRTSTTDDPTLHGGRSRQVPHVDGNWPSHVYLECEYLVLLLLT